jgi:hypothetical protein
MVRSGTGITLRLDRLDELFSPPAFGEFGASADLPSGIERLVAELKATSDAGEVTVVIPEGTTRDPGVEHRLALAIRSYANSRVRSLQHQRAALRREGLTSLLLAVPVVAILSVVSILVTKSSLHEEWRTTIDSFVIVFLWVALWYPLDTLFWYGRPLSQELRVLRRLEQGTVTVRGSSEGVGPGDGLDPRLSP